jgi:anti-sigma B factor antagonist
VTAAGQGQLTYHIETRKNTTIVHVSGEIDMTAEATLVRAFATVIGQRPAHIIVDLSGVGFMDSTGIRCLLTGQRDAHGAGVSFTIRNAEGIVAHVLTVTGVLDTLSTAPAAVPEPAAEEVKTRWWVSVRRALRRRR